MMCLLEFNFLLSIALLSLVLFNKISNKSCMKVKISSRNVLRYVLINVQSAETSYCIIVLQSFVQILLPVFNTAVYKLNTRTIVLGVDKCPKMEERGEMLSREKESARIEKLDSMETAVMKMDERFTEVREKIEELEEKTWEMEMEGV